MVKIAVIDNGVEAVMIRGQIKGNYALDHEGNLIESKEPDPEFLHGTIVTKIISDNLKNCEIFSISILDNSGKGKIEELCIALRWCLKNKITIANLSFGTTNFLDRKILLKEINHCVNQGLFIIAANSNHGGYTYPASFSNVIGVIYEGVAKEWPPNTDQYLGCDIMVLSKDDCQTLSEQPCNSYSAPYITAEAGKIAQSSNHKGMNVHKMKSELIESVKNDLRIYENSFMPDWISNAYLVDYEKISVEDFYFSTVSEIKKADTLVIQSQEKLNLYYKCDQNIVFLGNQKSYSPNHMGFFWSKENRIAQIKNSKECNVKIEMPIVLIEIIEEIDEIQVLNTLRHEFGLEGYQAYAMSFSIDSVLHDLEYVPPEFMEEESTKYLLDFCRWELHLKQCDILVITAEKKYSLKLKALFQEIDIEICIAKKSNITDISFYCDGVYKEAEGFDIWGREEIKQVYQVIKNYLQEPECE